MRYEQKAEIQDGNKARIYEARMYEEKMRENIIQEFDQWLNECPIGFKIKKPAMDKNDNKIIVEFNLKVVNDE